MLSCVKASIQQQQQQPSKILAAPECTTAQGAPFVYSNAVVAKDAVPEDSLSEDEQAEEARRSYTVQMDGGPLEESDGESSSDSLTRPSAMSTAVMVRANATDAATASMSPHLEAEGSSIPPPHYHHHHHHHQSAFFQETLLVEETMATMDIIICALVAAFVALQYRDIIQTCG